MTEWERVKLNFAFFGVCGLFGVLIGLAVSGKIG
jgi:hypothetical protein